MKIKKIFIDKNVDLFDGSDNRNKCQFKKQPLALAIFTAIVSTLTLTFPDTIRAETIINSNDTQNINSEWDLTADDTDDGNFIVGYSSDGNVIVGKDGKLTANNLNIGRNGADGHVKVENGGKIFINNTGNNRYGYPLTIGGDGFNWDDTKGGSGTLSIDGTGSEVNVDPQTGSVVIGSGGARGYLYISNGGQFIVKATADNHGVNIGNDGDGKNRADGYVDVKDENSLFYSGDSIYLGAGEYSGNLSVSNGGKAKTDRDLIVGQAVGVKGDNILSVSGNNSRVEANHVIIGRSSNTTGIVIVSDGGTLSAKDGISIAGEGYTAGAVGDLIIGGRYLPVAAGNVETPSITFGHGTGRIIFNHTNKDYQFSADISGSGNIYATSGSTELTGDNRQFNGRFTINKDGKLVVSKQENLGGTAGVDNDGELTLKSDSDWNFITQLHGTGVLNVDTNNHQFSFATGNGSNFTGTVALNNTNFALEDQNTSWLSDSTLQLNSGSVTTVGNGTQRIHGLTINGGKLIFDQVSPNKPTASNPIETSKEGQLDIRGSGQIQIKNPVLELKNRPVIDTDKNLMEQDDANSLVQLIKANGTVAGTGGQLELVDKDGNVISDKQQFDVTQNGKKVANASYDYQFTSGDKNDGLYINYGLKELELLGKRGDALTLTPSAGATGMASDLRAKLTGEGDLAIDSDGGRISLSNGGNDYTGNTFVRHGVLDMANDNVLGKTASLQLESGTGFDMHGYKQSIGQLETASGSLVNISKDSELTITGAQRTDGDRDGGTLEENTLIGSGALIVDNSDVTVNGSNHNFSGDVTLKSGSQLTLNQATGLGSLGKLTLTGADDKLDLNIAPPEKSRIANKSDSTPATTYLFQKSLAGKGSVSLHDSTDITLAGNNTDFSGIFNIDKDAALRASSDKHLGTADINLAGSLYLTSQNNWELKNAVNGAGELYKQGSGVLYVNRDLAYTGDTNVENGALVLGKDGTLSGSKQITVGEYGTFGGAGNVSGKVNNSGILSALNAIDGYNSAAASDFTIGELRNSGAINLAGGAVGNRLIVNGDYYGLDGSRLYLNTALGGDDSRTDKLVIKGNSSGSSDLYVYNFHGKGVQTKNGIERENQTVNLNSLIA
ncbi:MAG: hypothetical protein LBN41_12280 [Enterobacteriaceae bacterium]|jgi:autotransporter-associated beta strand protein|nr:hypothetical protein [Enterobacteriaceae bacterium]